MQVEQALHDRGRDVCVLEKIFSETHRFNWRFGGGNFSRSARGVGSSIDSSSIDGSSTDGSSISGSRTDGSSIIDSLDGEAHSSEIEGVLFRDSGLSKMGFSAVNGWSEADTSYMSSEMQAALLGWLWSLPGVVVNRLPAWLFLMPRPSLLQWIPLLTRAGLTVPSVVIGNSKERLRNWRAQHAEGAVLAPISTHTHFALHTDAEWEGVLRLAGHSTVALQQAHGETQLACVIGDTVVWNSRHGAASAQMQSLDASLLRFAHAAGLNFVQIAVAEQAQPLYGDLACAVVSVDTHPEFTLFEETRQHEITQALTDLLTSEESRDQHVPGSEAVVTAALAGGAR
jgi:hypothetical protein